MSSPMQIHPLTRKAFAPFGDVIEIAGAKHFPINQGFAERFDDLALIDVMAEGGTAKISLCEAKPRPFPIAIKLMERHPLGSQIFYPLQNQDWLVLVCQNPHDEKSYRCFRATRQQGVNYAKNTWHHPLLVLRKSQFLIVDRVGPGNNLEEAILERELSLVVSTFDEPFSVFTEWSGDADNKACQNL